jgi:hypothetical protein
LGFDDVSTSNSISRRIRISASSLFNEEQKQKPKISMLAGRSLYIHPDINATPPLLEAKVIRQYVPCTLLLFLLITLLFQPAQPTTKNRQPSPAKLIIFRHTLAFTSTASLGNLSWQLEAMQLQPRAKSFPL